MFFGTGIEEASLLVPATGRESPRSFPLLATPTPHVNWVLYPEQSFPWSRHCEQYGLRRSHCNSKLLHVKQSAAAPAVGALFRLFLGEAFPSIAACGEVVGGVGILVMLAIVAMVIVYCISSHARAYLGQQGIYLKQRQDVCPTTRISRRKSLFPLPPCSILLMYMWSCYNVHLDVCAIISGVI